MYNIYLPLPLTCGIVLEAPELGVTECISLEFSNVKLGASSSNLNLNFKYENSKLLHSVTPNSELLIEQFSLIPTLIPHSSLKLYWSFSLQAPLTSQLPWSTIKTFH